MALASACGDDLDAAGPDGGPGGGADAGPEPDADPGDQLAPIERSQAGGAPTSLVLVDQLAYITMGARLTIWDVGDRTAPRLVGESEPLSGQAMGVVVAGDRAYVTVHRTRGDGEVHVVDISDPAAPENLGSVRTTESEFSWPRDGIVIDNNLYIADSETGIAVFDLTDPDAPALTLILGVYGATRLQVVDRRLYYAARSFFGDVLVGALDLDADYAFLGEISLLGAYDARVTETHVAVGVGGGGFTAYDMSDPSQPVELYHNDQMGSRALAASGGTAWVPGLDGLYVVDLTADPVAVTGPIAMPSEGADGADYAGDLFATVTDRGDLLLVDGPATAPELRSVTEVSVCTMCGGVAATSDLVYVADLAAGIRTARLGDLVQLGHGYPSKVMDLEDVVVVDGIAFTADWFFGVRAFDVSDPTDVRQIGELDTAGYPGGVDYQDGLLYLAEGTEGGAMRIIDVSDPTDMRELGAVLTSKAQEVDVVGNLAFVADEAVFGPGGLRIFDVSDPTSIQQVGHYEDCQYALDVAVTGNVAVVACSGDDFHLVDVSDPTAPTRLAVWQPSDELAAAWSVAVRGTHAYLGHDSGVVALDISDPTSPRLIAEYETPYTVRGLTSPGPGRIVAAAVLAGLYQWQLPEEPESE